MAAAVALLASFSSGAQRLEALLLDWGSYLIPEAEQTHSVAVVAIDAATVATGVVLAPVESRNKNGAGCVSAARA